MTTLEASTQFMPGFRRAPLGLLVLLAASCGGDGTGPGAATGSIRVTTVTSGPGAVSHNLFVNGAERGPIGNTAERLIEDLAPGVYSIGLATVTANCTSGTNPRLVTVTGGVATPVTFTITCAEPPVEWSAISIIIQTEGAVPDPNGYTVTLDGVTQAAPVNGGFAIGNVPVGTRTLELSGLAPGCTVAGSAQRSVEVQAGLQATEEFDVTCGAAGSAGP